MPINQLSGAIQLSPEWSLRGQYFLEWRPNRLPEGGTYFGAADMLFSGPDRLFAGAAGQIPRGPAVEPDRKGTNNFGLNLRYNPEKMSDTTFGVYYRKFDETQPWAPVFSLAPPSPVPRDYHLSYAKDTQMVAGSVQTAVGPVSVGGELIYRKNTALNSNTTFVSSNGSVRDFAGVEGARGNTLHAVVNGVYLLPRTALWESGTLVGEMVYSRLLEVTRNARPVQGRRLPGLQRGDGLQHRRRQAGGRQERRLRHQGCAAAQRQLHASMAAGVSGRGPVRAHVDRPTACTAMARPWAAATKAPQPGRSAWRPTCRQKYQFGISWNDSNAGYNTAANGVVTTTNGNAVQNNHGWLAMTFKTTF